MTLKIAQLITVKQVRFFDFSSCRKVYWVDGHYGSIHVMELDGRYQKKLLSGQFTTGNDTYIITRPRAVAANPKFGYSCTHSHTLSHKSLQVPG